MSFYTDMSMYSSYLSMHAIINQCQTNTTSRTNTFDSRFYAWIGSSNNSFLFVQMMVIVVFSFIFSA